MQYLSISEFRARFGIGATLTYELLKTGKLRAVKIGRCTRISLESAEAWAKSLPSAFPTCDDAA